jgi:hypothetical protein
MALSPAAATIFETRRAQMFPALEASDIERMRRFGTMSSPVPQPHITPFIPGREESPAVGKCNRPDESVVVWQLGDHLSGRDLP